MGLCATRHDLLQLVLLAGGLVLPESTVYVGKLRFHLDGLKFEFLLWVSVSCKYSRGIVNRCSVIWLSYT